MPCRLPYRTVCTTRPFNTFLGNPFALEGEAQNYPDVQLMAKQLPSKNAFVSSLDWYPFTHLPGHLYYSYTVILFPVADAQRFVSKAL